MERAYIFEPVRALAYEAERAVAIRVKGVEDGGDGLGERVGVVGVRLGEVCDGGLLVLLLVGDLLLDLPTRTRHGRDQSG